MKIILTAAAIVCLLGGCWSEEKAKKSSAFMDGLSKCDNCTISKPFIGGDPNAR